MKQLDYQKNILLELMNLEEFKQKDFVENKTEQITSVNLTSPSKATSINQLEDFLKGELIKLNIDKSIKLVEGNKNSRILFFYGKCDISDTKIIDNKNGELFDKMLSSIKLDRKQISLASYIPRGIGEFESDHKMITTLQLVNYRLIELINPKYLIIMSNYCIKMLLAADLSSMSLRGKWFDFNTPNDVVPKKCRVLYEPSLLINNPDLKKDAWEDLKEIKKQLGG